MNYFVLEILTASWDVFLKSAPFMLFGFLVAGLLKVFVSPEKIAQYLGRGKIRSVFLAALAGIPLPLCSCGVVPAAAGLKKQGANRGATISFLISTPETGMDSIPLTYVLMGPLMALMRPVAAFVTSLTAGILENYFGKPPTGDSGVAPRETHNNSCSCQSACAGNPGLAHRIRSGLKYAYVELLGDIGPWFVIGVLVAGLISTLVPDNFAQAFLGGRFSAMLVMLAAGVPMYICATSSTPIAAALVLKGLSPGAALVFLLAGPATNVASLTMVASLLGKRALSIYLGAISTCALLFGWLTDMVYLSLSKSAPAALGQAADLLPPAVEIGGALLLIALIVNAALRAPREADDCRCSTREGIEPIK